MQLRKFLRVAVPIIIVKSILSAIFLLSFFAEPALAALGDETTYYLLTDHLGSVDVVLDEDGNVVERRDYLPYGSARAEESAPVAPATDHRFTGKELDPETDLYYYGARYYDPLIGRFVSVDPVVKAEGSKLLAEILQNPQALNAYSYVLNNPVRYVDETGMYGEDVHYDLTFFLASLAGLDFEQSQTIAHYNQYTDENPATLPGDKQNGLLGMAQTYKNVTNGTTEKYHFADTQDTLKEVVGLIGTGNLSGFGEALHTFQDTYSHHNLNPFMHYVLEDRPDITTNNPEKAMHMAKGSFLLLRVLNATENGTGDLTLEQYDVQTEAMWKVANPVIAEFVTAEEKADTLIGRASMQLKNISQEKD